MKAITLHQPWASLIAEGVKTIETRSWAPPARLIGQRIAIHAGKAKVARVPVPDDILVKGFPLGAIVATAKLAWYGKVIDLEKQGMIAVVETHPDEGIYADVDPYGDFTVGRWLWGLEEIKPIEPPIPARGYQGFWEWQEQEASDGQATD